MLVEVLLGFETKVFFNLPANLLRGLFLTSSCVLHCAFVSPIQAPAFGYILSATCHGNNMQMNHLLPECVSSCDNEVSAPPHLPPSSTKATVTEIPESFWDEESSFPVDTSVNRCRA